jgi:hypothetical protein
MHDSLFDSDPWVKRQPQMHKLFGLPSNYNKETDSEIENCLNSKQKSVDLISYLDEIMDKVSSSSYLSLFTIRLLIYFIDCRNTH